MRNHPRILALPLLLALPLASCDGTSRPGRVLRAELEAARGRWTDAGITTYAITERRLCFCPPPFEWTAVVWSGTPQFIEAVEVLPGGESEATLAARALAGARSVEQLFDFIESLIDTADEVEVSFDPVAGFPRKLSVDFLFGAADDEVTWELSNLVDLAGTACTEIACAPDGVTVMLHGPSAGFTPGTYAVRLESEFGSAWTCTFRVSADPAECPSGPCVASSDCAGVVLFPGPQIPVSFPVVDGQLTITVERDGSELVTESVAADYQRLQPNGPFCPPVCYQMNVDVTVP